MFTANQPFSLSLHAKLIGSALHFKDTETVLRYRKLPTHPLVDPRFSNGALISGPWTLDEIAPSNTARLFVLKFKGDVMTDIVQCDRDAPLFVATLDQTNYALTFKAGTLSALPGDPPCEEADLFLSLYLKLNLVIDPVGDEQSAP